MHSLFNSKKRSAAAVRPIVLIIALAAVVMAVIVIRSTSPSQQIEKKQAALLEGIAKRSRSKVEKLIATDYHDRWQFGKEDAVTAFLDLGSQFMVLAVQSIDPITDLAEDGKYATVTTRLQIAGSGSPLAQMIITRSNKLKEPFVFRWQKQSWWPGSWRLVEVDNPDLPDDLDGYQPGDIRKAMSFKFPAFGHGNSLVKAIGAKAFWRYFAFDALPPFQPFCHTAASFPRGSQCLR